MRLALLSTAGFGLSILTAAACGGSDPSASSTSTSSSGSTSASSTSSTSSSGTGGTSSSSSSGAGGAGGFMTAKHLPFPPLDKTGTGELKAPRVVAIVPQNETAQATAAFQDFTNKVGGSSWYATWSTAYPELGAMRPSVFLSGAAIPSGTLLQVSDGFAYVDSTLKSANDPSLAADGATVYVVFLPEGVSYQGAQGAPGVNGHHYTYDILGDGMGWVQRSATSSLLSVQAVMSHEIAEAATDTGKGWRVETTDPKAPWKSSVWAAWEGVSPTKGGFLENGDFCEGTRSVEAGITYQRVYTNRAVKAGGDPCEPALPIPYFNVSPDAEWVQAKAGEVVDIPITGWSTAPTDDFWAVAEVAAQRTTKEMYTVTLDSPQSGQLKGMTLPTLNNGVQGTLHVTVPANVTAGSWAVFSVWTWHADAKNITPPGEDRSHLGVVGVYVP